MSAPQTETRRPSLISRIGLAILVLSLVFWAFFLVIPFLPLSTGRKAAVGGVNFIIAEATFWLGAVLAGKEIVTRFKTWMNPKWWLEQLRRTNRQ